MINNSLTIIALPIVLTFDSVVHYGSVQGGFEIVEFVVVLVSRLVHCGPHNKVEND